MQLFFWQKNDNLFWHIIQILSHFLKSHPILLYNSRLRLSKSCFTVSLAGDKVGIPSISVQSLISLVVLVIITASAECISSLLNVLLRQGIPSFSAALIRLSCVIPGSISESSGWVMSFPSLRSEMFAYEHSVIVSPLWKIAISAPRLERVYRQRRSLGSWPFSRRTFRPAAVPRLQGI